jgi:hypothetical protein
MTYLNLSVLWHFCGTLWDDIGFYVFLRAFIGELGFTAVGSYCILWDALGFNCILCA